MTKIKYIFFVLLTWGRFIKNNQQVKPAGHCLHSDDSCTGGKLRHTVRFCSGAKTRYFWNPICFRKVSCKNNGKLVPRCASECLRRKSMKNAKTMPVCTRRKRMKNARFIHLDWAKIARASKKCRLATRIRCQKSESIKRVRTPAINAFVASTNTHSALQCRTEHELGTIQQWPVLNIRAVWFTKRPRPRGKATPSTARNYHNSRRQAESCFALNYSPRRRSELFTAAQLKTAVTA